MHYLGEEHILLFLIQTFILLASAKIVGGFFLKRGMPSLAGEILIGIILGPTIFGRLAPEIQKSIFPHDMVQMNMLETVSWIGVLLLLLVTGFEVSLSSAWKQGKASISIGVIGVVIPMIIGVAAFWFLPEKYWGPSANQLTFTLFLSTAASISAIAVIARILHDLEILKSDLGLTLLSGFVVNDLLGWLVFAFVLSFASQHETDLNGIIVTFIQVIIFGFICLTVGSKFVGTVVKKIHEIDLPHPATTLTFISCLAMGCGAITQSIGIHAILGFFLAGVMVGNTNQISERSKEIMSQMVHALFVPIFFASIGLKVDFVSQLDMILVIIFTSVAIGGKLVGAWVGAKFANMSNEDSLSTGIAFIPGGAMEIVLGLLALEIGIVSETTFVAIVFAALASSVAVGPLLAWSLDRRKHFNVANFLKKDFIIPDLQSKTKWGAIAELCTLVADSTKVLDPKDVVKSVTEREEIMGTGMEKGLAVPHGRLPNIEKPIIAFARSEKGIDWDARDGLSTNYVFLILSPTDDDGMQVQILAAIARLFMTEAIHSELNGIKENEAIFKIISDGLKSNFT